MMKHQINKLSIGLEKLFIDNSVKDVDKSLKQLKYSNDTFIDDQKLILVFGLLVGVIFTAFTLIIFYKENLRITVMTDSEFQTIFPIWRGASYLIFYTWILGFDIWLFEYFKIDYKQILPMEFSYHPPVSYTHLTLPTICSV